MFLVLGGISFLYPAADAFLAGYGRALAAAILAAVIFLLLPVMPFTEQYARESVPREYWHSPTVPVDQPADQRGLGRRDRGDGAEPRRRRHVRDA